MPLLLRWRGSTTAPVEANSIRPDRLTGPAGAVAHLAIRIGNQPGELGDLFEIAGDGGDGEVQIAGDLRTVHGLGPGMTSGRLVIDGDVGHRLGVEMEGGEIRVRGTVGSGAGGDMRGGSIRIGGHVGDDLGGALPGSRVGMRGGLILVGGNAGAGVGTALRRGIIAVAGSAGPGLGRGLVAGSIFVGGAVGPGLGSGMKRGTIGLWGLADGPVDPGPTFEPSGSLRPPVATILLRQLRDWSFPVPDHAFAGRFRRYNGDQSIGGQGEIWEFGPHG